MLRGKGDEGVYLVEVDLPDGEPFADEDDDGAAQPVHAALV